MCFSCTYELSHDLCNSFFASMLVFINFVWQAASLQISKAVCENDSFDCTRRLHFVKHLFDYWVLPLACHSLPPNHDKLSGANSFWHLNNCAIDAWDDIIIKVALFLDERFVSSRHQVSSARHKFLIILNHCYAHDKFELSQIYKFKDAHWIILYKVASGHKTCSKLKYNSIFMQIYCHSLHYDFQFTRSCRRKSVNCSQARLKANKCVFNRTIKIHFSAVVLSYWLMWPAVAVKELFWIFAKTLNFVVLSKTNTKHADEM